MSDRTQEARERILNEAFEAPSPLAHLADRVSTLETALLYLGRSAHGSCPDCGRAYAMQANHHTNACVIYRALAEGDNRP